MSGHSKWATIRRDKEANDSKKGALFTKLSRDITAAAKSGGGDPSMNATLAAAITKAKAANMPNDKIQKAINKGIGVSKSGLAISDVSYEAYGPGEVGMIIDAYTDNRNRTVGEVKSTLEKSGGRFMEGGSVAWLFEVRGEIMVPFETNDERKKREGMKWGANDGLNKLQKEKSEDFELEIMSQDDILDIETEDNAVYIYTTPDSVGKIRKHIEQEMKIYVDDAQIIKNAKVPVAVTDDIKQRVEDLVAKLKDLDDVEEVWTAIS